MPARTRKSTKRSVFDGADVWTQLKHSSNRWRCSRDPTYTAKPKCNSQILIHYKNGKDFNSSEHHLGRLLSCSRLMKGQKAGRATVTADPDSRHPPAEKTERTFVNCKTMVSVQSCQRRNNPVPLLGCFQWILLRNRRARDFI